MSKKLFYLLGIAVTIILGTILYLLFCCNCCVSAKTVENSEKTVDTSDQNHNPFVLTGSEINYRCNDNFNFLKNNATLITPVSDSLTLGLEKLKTILIANPDQKISITGYAMANESNTTNFDNLGLARANDIKKFFVSMGLSAVQFETKGELIDNWEIRNDTVLGPLNFKFDDIKAVVKNADDNSFKAQLNANPLIFFFNTNQANYSLNADEHQKIKAIANYIAQKPNAMVLVVGPVGCFN